VRPPSGKIKWKSHQIDGFILEEKVREGPREISIGTTLDEFLGGSNDAS